VSWVKRAVPPSFASFAVEPRLVAFTSDLRDAQCHMSLTRFVRNVDDLSDDGGYKFRFRCDRCGDGVESEYVSSATNILKTGLEVFGMFRYFGSVGNAVEHIDRGLRGKEHDAAFERAVNEAMVHFSKCSHCGNWVCDHCFNKSAGLCEGCAPDAHEAIAQAAARRAAEGGAAAAFQSPQAVASVVCVSCTQPSGGGKFCQNCGASCQPRICPKCTAPLTPSAKFCGECGTGA
jgi:hypothetical protein